jgi:hypothetical protein
VAPEAILALPLMDPLMYQLSWYANEQPAGHIGPQEPTLEGRHRDHAVTTCKSLGRQTAG